MENTQNTIPALSQVPADQLNSNAFRRWFAGSTVARADGTPLMVFHGTAREDRAFRSSRHVDMEGAYFTSDFEAALDHAQMDSVADGEDAEGYVIAVLLSLKNPFIMTGIDSHVITTGQRLELESKGHDGVIGVDDDGSVFEYVVFNPAQIADFHQGVLSIPEPPRRCRAPAHDDGPSL